jgi:molybdopterin-synthase adenylyltransferase
VTTAPDFSRQSFLGADSERNLADTRVLIVGLGGGGSHIAQQLAHLGVGHIALVDPQTIEASNLNRLIGATDADVQAKTPKVDIARRLIKGIRPWIDVEVSQTTWQAADHFLRLAHVVFGCLDGFRQRMYLESAARSFLLPFIDIGMDVTRLSEDRYTVAGQMILTLPGGPCMRCLGFLKTEHLEREENEYGDVGINPQVVWTNGTLASLAVGAFVRLMTPWFPTSRGFEWLELDGDNQLVSRSRQPDYMASGPCIHFSNAELGDPFFQMPVQGETPK